MAVTNEQAPFQEGAESRPLSDAGNQRPVMRVGINYAWLNYAWDFGPPPYHDDGTLWGDRAQWKTRIDDDLNTFRRLGIFAVRWFILGDGLTYGVGLNAPHRTSQVGRHEAWGFDPPTVLAAEFQEDFVELLERFRRADVQLLPSLIDFYWCAPGVRFGNHFVKGGRSDVMNDPSKRTIFLDVVLDRLLRLSQPYSNIIYAWELINEPEWCTPRSWLRGGGLDSIRSVPFENMVAFIREGARRINEASFRSTVGFANYRSLRRWDSPGLNLTLHQFHYYGSPRALPPHRFNRPAFIGEFATARHIPWSELSTNDVYSRLRHIEGKGYPAAFLWSADDRAVKQPGAVDWSESTQMGVQLYTSESTRDRSRT